MLSSEAQDGCGLTKSNKVAIKAFIIYYLALLTSFPNQLNLDISPCIDRDQSRFKDPYTCVPVAQLPWRRHLTDHGIHRALHGGRFTFVGDGVRETEWVGDRGQGAGELWPSPHICMLAHYAYVRSAYRYPYVSNQTAHVHIQTAESLVFQPRSPRDTLS